jgi:hypothetical protein
MWFPALGILPFANGLNEHCPANWPIRRRDPPFCRNKSPQNQAMSRRPEATFLARRWLALAGSLLCLIGVVFSPDCRALAEDPVVPRFITASFGSRLGRFLRWDDEKPGKDRDNGDASKNADDKDDKKENGKNGDQDDEDDDSKDDEKDRIETDRPDFTESTSTVGKGVLQFEGGYTYTRAPEGKPALNEHDLPELLIRYGVAERLELRCAWEGVVWNRSDRNATDPLNETGCTDADFGFKYAMTKQDKWRPATSIIAAVTAPWGSPTQSNQQVGCVINYVYSWELSKKLALAGSTNHSWATEADDWFSYIGQSLSLQYELTDRVGVFNEFYALFRRESENNGTQCYYDGGLTYLVTKNFQLDWRAGWGLTDSSDRFFTGCGLAFRR